MPHLVPIRRWLHRKVSSVSVLRSWSLFTVEILLKGQKSKCRMRLYSQWGNYECARMHARFAIPSPIAPYLQLLSRGNRHHAASVAARVHAGRKIRHSRTAHGVEAARARRSARYDGRYTARLWTPLEFGHSAPIKVDSRRLLPRPVPCVSVSPSRATYNWASWRRGEGESQETLGISALDAGHNGQ